MVGFWRQWRALPLLFALLSAPVLASLGPATDPPASVAFERLMSEAGMVFEAPAEFVDIPGEANPLFAYERAVRHRQGLMEVRYAVRPLERIQIEYDDPHGAAPEPDHLFPLLFDSITQRLAGGGHSPRREYPSEQARELFNADWAAVSVFDVDPAFSQNFRQGLLVAMHRSGKADAYVVCLYNDYAAVKPILNHAMSSLRFAP